MAKRKQDKYEDPVNRTFRLYGPQIKEAYKELKEENPNFGKIEYSKGKYVNVKISEEKITGISFTTQKD